jgi:hypothetical protein
MQKSPQLAQTKSAQGDKIPQKKKKTKNKTNKQTEKLKNNNKNTTKNPTSAAMVEKKGH